MAERRTLIAGNWKMNGSQEMGATLVLGLSEKLRQAGRVPFDMLVCPPAPLIGAAVNAKGASALHIGGQDCHYNVSGAHTGDIAAALLKDMGCTYVIVGHSERRADHNESDAIVRQKAEAAIAAGLVPIICVGETEAERKSGNAEAVVCGQVKNSLPTDAENAAFVVAYEPVWAIGTGLVPTVADVDAMHKAIRAQLAESTSAAKSANVQVLYGGSVKPSNAAELLAVADVDGALVGGASLKVDDFWGIAQTCL
jgi:triosephosphate isomerase